MTRDDFPEHVRCFGQAVVQMRELRKISREELAKKSKVPLELLAKIEDGTATGADFGLKEIYNFAMHTGELTASTFCHPILLTTKPYLRL